jgi:hypothetical protein
MIHVDERGAFLKFQTKESLIEALSQLKPDQVLMLGYIDEEEIVRRLEPKHILLDTLSQLKEEIQGEKIKALEGYTLVYSAGAICGLDKALSLLDKKIKQLSEGETNG